MRYRAISAFILLAVVSIFHPCFAQDLSVYVLGQPFESEMLTRSGTVYVPALKLAKALQLKVDVTPAGVILNGKPFAPIVKDAGVIYVPLKAFALAAGDKVKYNAETQILEISAGGNHASGTPYVVLVSQLSYAATKVPAGRKDIAEYLKSLYTWLSGMNQSLIVMAGKWPNLQELWGWKHGDPPSIMNPINAALTSIMTDVDPWHGRIKPYQKRLDEIVPPAEFKQSHGELRATMDIYLSQMDAYNIQLTLFEQADAAAATPNDEDHVKHIYQGYCLKAWNLEVGVANWLNESYAPLLARDLSSIGVTVSGVSPAPAAFASSPAQPSTAPVVSPAQTAVTTPSSPLAQALRDAEGKYPQALQARKDVAAYLAALSDWGDRQAGVDADLETRLEGIERGTSQEGTDAENLISWYIDQVGQLQDEFNRLSAPPEFQGVTRDYAAELAQYHDALSSLRDRESDTAASLEMADPGDSASLEAQVDSELKELESLKSQNAAAALGLAAKIAPILKSNLHAMLRRMPEVAVVGEVA